MNRRKHDARKARHWQRTIGEAAQSGMSIREFCRQRRLRESQFYWWQHKLKLGREERGRQTPRVNGNCSRIGQPSFALVSDELQTTDVPFDIEAQCHSNSCAGSPRRRFQTTSCTELKHLLL
ncbi:MAG: hypothetical protein DMG26_12575 [Acidobacteria bacterium]|nr:MAG: hypothetical protein DMG26_12575 [Acidobacteriota bacterium]